MNRSKTIPNIQYPTHQLSIQPPPTSLHNQNTRLNRRDDKLLRNRSNRPLQIQTTATAALNQFATEPGIPPTQHNHITSILGPLTDRLLRKDNNLTEG